MEKLKPLLFLSVFLFLSCQPGDHEHKFLFIGHSYDWENENGNGIDPRVLSIPLAEYDGFWFGGDICSETSLNPETMKRLDKHFDFKNPNNHFVLGNHEYRNHNHEMYSNLTGRPNFYTTGFENIVVSVLNTNLNSSNCEKLNAQYRMLENVTDSLSIASHYILLMHHQIFPLFDGMAGYKSNGISYHYAMNCHEAASSFEKVIYPKLQALEEKGIEVIVVVGDSGWHKESYAETNSGITFLASGINNSFNKQKKIPLKDEHQDRVLEFKLDTKARTLEWEFTNLNRLIGVDKETWLTSK